MSTAKPCSIDGCLRPLLSKGLCRVHYERAKRHGSPHILLKPVSPRGAPMAWIKQNVGYSLGDCLIWPFARTPDGRAHMRLNRVTVKPSRVMCEFAHGAPPTPSHEAAHSCGRAHDGCVNPRHLRWATSVENAADKITHGTLVVGERHYNSKLTAESVLEIRRLKGVMTLSQIAARYGVKMMCVHKVISGKTWRHVA